MPGALRQPSPALQAWLRQRIAEQPSADAPGDWPRRLMHEHGVLLIDGNQAELWFLDGAGAVYSLDPDRVAGRLERETDPARAREVLVRAAQRLPELAELLREPSAGTAATAEVVSPDGRLRAASRPDSRLAGYDHEEVTRLVISDAATGAVAVDMHLRHPGLRVLRFLGPKRLLFAADDGRWCEKDLAAGSERWLQDPAGCRDDYAPLRFDSVTGRAGVVGMVAFGVASALAALGAVGAFTMRDGIAWLMVLFAIGFALLAVASRTYRAHQELDVAAGEVRERRCWALHERARSWSLASFDRVQHWRGLNRGAALYYLTLEGRERCLLLPRSRDPAALLTVGAEIANRLGLSWHAAPVPDRCQPPR